MGASGDERHIMAGCRHSPAEIPPTAPAAITAIRIRQRSGCTGKGTVRPHGRGSISGFLLYRRLDCVVRALTYCIPLERSECRPQSNHRDEPENSTDDRNHDDVQIAFPMGRSADSEQRDHGAVVR